MIGLGGGDGSAAGGVLVVAAVVVATVHVLGAAAVGHGWHLLQQLLPAGLREFDVRCAK